MSVCQSTSRVRNRLRAAARVALALAIIMAANVQSPTLEAGLLAAVDRAFSVAAAAVSTSQATFGNSGKIPNTIELTKTSDTVTTALGERAPLNTSLGDLQLQTELQRAADQEPQSGPSADDTTSTPATSTGGGAGRSAGNSATNALSGSSGSHGGGGSSSVGERAALTEQDQQSAPTSEGPGDLSGQSANPSLLGLEHLDSVPSDSWIQQSRLFDYNDLEAGGPTLDLGSETLGSAVNNSSAGQQPDSPFANPSFGTGGDVVTSLPDLGPPSSPALGGGTNPLVGGGTIGGDTNPLEGSDELPEVEPQAVPEPGTLGLLGVASVIAWRRSRNRQRQLRA